MNDGRCRYSGVQREMVLDFFEFVGFDDEPGKEGNSGKATAGCSSLSLSFSHSCTHAFAHTQSLSHQQTHSLSLSLVHSNLCVCACANPRFIVFLSEGKH